MTNIATLLENSNAQILEVKANIETIVDEDEKEDEQSYLDMLVDDDTFFKCFAALVAIDEEKALELAREQDSSPRDAALIAAKQDGYFKNKSGYTVFW